MPTTPANWRNGFPGDIRNAAGKEPPNTAANIAMTVIRTAHTGFLANMVTTLDIPMPGHIVLRIEITMTIVMVSRWILRDVPGRV